MIRLPISFENDAHGGTAMLMALLYTEADRIIAAAPACDQFSQGKEYWLENHEADLSAEDIFETSIVFVADPNLQARLLRVGIDDSIDSVSLTREVASQVAPPRTAGKAA